MAIILILLPGVKIYYEFTVEKEPNLQRLIVDLLFVFLPTAIITVYTNAEKIFQYAKKVPIEVFQKINSDLKISEQDFTELAQVARRFFNSGRYDRQKILNAFNVSVDDYFCVIKSDENLEYLYEKKRKLNSRQTLGKFPLGEMLRNIPGAVQPFRNMDVYFVPYKSLGRYGKNYKRYLSKEVLKKLPNKRELYLNRLKSPLKLSNTEY